MKVKVSCVRLCDPMDHSVQGILQARILEWVAVPFSRVSSQPRDQIQLSCIAGRFFTSWATRESPLILEWAAYPFSSRSSRPRNWTGLSCISGGFFTSWATRQAQCGRPGFGPWVGKIPGEGIGYPLQYSGLYSGHENSMDCIVHGWVRHIWTWTTFVLFAWFSSCH